MGSITAQSYQEPSSFSRIAGLPGKAPRVAAAIATAGHLAAPISQLKGIESESAAIDERLLKRQKINVNVTIEEIHQFVRTSWTQEHSRSVVEITEPLVSTIWAGHPAFAVAYPIFHARRQRLRPILMTAWANYFGKLHLAIGRGSERN